MNEDRDLSLDFMKGSAIFLVVLGHVLQYASGVEHHPFRDFIYSIHIPLFFFVSGFLVSKKLSMKQNILLFVSKKSRLILPLLLFGTFDVVICGADLGGFLSWSKFGLWFLWMLFLFNMTYSASQMVLLKNKRKWIEIGVLVLPALIGVSLRIWKDTPLGLTFNFMQAYNYIFFLMGITISRYKLKKYIMDDRLGVLLLLVYITGLSTGISALNIPMKVAGVLLLFCIIKKLNSEILSTKWGGYFVSIGRYTLYIYILHFYPLRTIITMPESVRNFVFVSPCIYIPIFSSISMFIIWFSIVIAKCLCSNEYIRKYVFGVK